MHYILYVHYNLLLSLFIYLFIFNQETAGMLENIYFFPIYFGTIHTTYIPHIPKATMKHL